MKFCIKILSKKSIQLSTLALCLVSFLFFNFSPLIAQSKDEKKILSILNAQVNAWNQGDFDTFMVGYVESDSLMYIGKGGVTYGYQSTLARYKKTYSGADKMGTLHFDILHMKRLGRKHYLVVGKWSLKRTAGDVGGHYTLTFEKQNGKWVVIADHSS